MSDSYLVIHDIILLIIGLIKTAYMGVFMANLILIHGAWHNAKVWDKLMPYIDKKHKVIAIEMPGRNPSDTRTYRHINLETYVRTIEEVISSLDSPCYLLGHSLAGLSISQVAQNMPDKIKALIYLCAFIPSDGESMLDITSQIKNPGIKTELEFHPKANRININRSDITRETFYQNCLAQDANAALSALNPEPLRAFSSHVSLSKAFDLTQKIYIKATKDRSILAAEQDKMILKANIQKTVEIDSDHSPFLSCTTKLSNILNTILEQN